MQIKGIIFDLDGTLLETLTDLANSVNYALAQFGLPGHQVEDYKMKVGAGIRHLVLQALPADKQELTDEVLAIQTEYYEKHCCDITAAYPGIINLLDKLHSLGYKLAVLSNKIEPMTIKTVDHFFDIELFDIVRGHTPQFNLKPDPASALAIAQQWSLPVDQIAFVGDSDVDMLTAKNAGMLAIGASWGFRTVEQLKENGADIIIDSADELLKYLG